MILSRLVSDNLVSIPDFTRRVFLERKSAEGELQLNLPVMAIVETTVTISSLQLVKRRVIRKKFGNLGLS